MNGLITYSGITTKIRAMESHFLTDDDFIRYVMDCEPDKESYWASYLTAVPEIRTAYLKAYDILMHLDDCDLLTPEETATLKQRVMHTLHTIAN